MTTPRDAADTTALDEQNPWPGLAAFDEPGRRFFNGRNAEIEELLRKVEQAALTVLFGKSGLGKSSLLKAGLFPRLRERNFLPVYVRLDIRAGAPPPMQQVRDALQATIDSERIDAPALRAEEGLWAYLHRPGLEFWNERNFLVSPVFVLDQFEEVFTLGERMPDFTGRLKVDLGDLAENRIPAALTATLGSDGREHDVLQVRAMVYKVLISLREDYLPELESWRNALPSLGKTRMRLLPLRPEQALSAVHDTAPHLIDRALAQRVVDFVAAAQVQQAASPEPQAEPTPAADRTAEIEPALLSLFCRGLNDQRKRLGKQRIDAELLDAAKQGILADYYRSCFEGMPAAVSRFVETELISEKGYRNSYAKDDAVPSRLSQEQLERLINRRLVRIEDRYGTQRIELTHDLLTHVVREQRDRFRAEEEKALLAQRTEEERKALEAEVRQREERLEAQRQAEETRRLQVEARAGRIFKRLAAALTGAMVLAVAIAGVAYWQWQRADVERAEAVTQRALATERLKRITDGIALKQAVLSGNRARIREYLGSALATNAVRFTASAKDLNYRMADGRKVYRFRLFPDPASLPEVKSTVAVVTYRMDHPTFNNALLATGPERDFAAGYDGWGCLRSVVVLLEYLDPDRPPQITEYDMCAALK